MHSHVPAVSQALIGSIAHKFLLRNYELMAEGKSILVSQINIWWETLNGGGEEVTRVFEDWHGWLNTMQHIVTSLGLQLASGTMPQSLTTPGTPHAFVPTAVILSELEKISTVMGLACETHNTPPKGWAAKCLFDIGITHSGVITAYTRVLLDSFDGDGEITPLQLGPSNAIQGGITVSAADISVVTDTFKLHLVESSLAVVVNWFTAALTNNMHARNGHGDVSDLIYFVERGSDSGVGISESKSTDLVLSARSRSTEPSRVKSPSKLDEFLSAADQVLMSVTAQSGARAALRASLLEERKRISVLEKQFTSNKF